MTKFISEPRVSSPPPHLPLLSSPSLLTQNHTLILPSSHHPHPSLNSCPPPTSPFTYILIISSLHLLLLLLASLFSLYLLCLHHSPPPILPVSSPHHFRGSSSYHTPNPSLHPFPHDPILPFLTSLLCPTFSHRSSCASSSSLHCLRHSMSASAAM